MIDYRVGVLAFREDRGIKSCLKNPENNFIFKTPPGAVKTGKVLQLTLGSLR